LIRVRFQPHSASKKRRNSEPQKPALFLEGKEEP
jgi:hypothetical protein